MKGCGEWEARNKNVAPGDGERVLSTEILAVHDTTDLVKEHRVDHPSLLVFTW